MEEEGTHWLGGVITRIMNIILRRVGCGLRAAGSREVMGVKCGSGKNKLAIIILSINSLFFLHLCILKDRSVNHI